MALIITSFKKTLGIIRKNKMRVILLFFLQVVFFLALSIVLYKTAAPAIMHAKNAVDYYDNLSLGNNSGIGNNTGSIGNGAGINSSMGSSIGNSIGISEGLGFSYLGKSPWEVYENYNKMVYYIKRMALFSFLAFVVIDGLLWAFSSEMINSSKEMINSSKEMINSSKEMINSSKEMVNGVVNKEGCSRRSRSEGSKNRCSRNDSSRDIHISSRILKSPLENLKQLLAYLLSYLLKFGVLSLSSAFLFYILVFNPLKSFLAGLADLAESGGIIPVKLLLLIGAAAALLYFLSISCSIIGGRKLKESLGLTFSIGISKFPGIVLICLINLLVLLLSSYLLYLAAEANILILTIALVLFVSGFVFMRVFMIEYTNRLAEPS